MYENLYRKNLFVIESAPLNKTVAAFMENVAKPQLVTLYEKIPSLDTLTRFDAGIFHLTKLTRNELDPRNDIDTILKLEKSRHKLVVLASLSIVGDRGTSEVEELQKSGIKTYVNTDIESYLLAIHSLNDLLNY